MAKLKISAAQYEEAHKQFGKFLAKELPDRGLRKLVAKFKGDGGFGRRLSKKWYGKFLADGGKVGDWESFFKYLIENLPAIIAAIMALFA